MTANEAIILNNVSKRYRVYSSPQDRLREILGLNVDPNHVMQVNALDSVSFKINWGEFCGIIGRNGAGKSTLLKIIAGQSYPTDGTLKAFGRISLLQLGVGFDGELTGRENICNSIRYTLMTTSVPDELINQIIEFSELGEFINFPIKTYSSGMYSRLGFATAVSVDPDILIADEVLAVGDINFSQKCLVKMREFKERGKTVILVTHDLNAVRVFCDRAILLDHGRLIRDGDPQEVCEEYRNLMLYGVPLDRPTENIAANRPIDSSADNGPDSPQDASLEGWQTPRKETFVLVANVGSFKAIRFRTGVSMAHSGVVTAGMPVGFDLLFHLNEGAIPHSVGFTMHDDRGQTILHLNSAFAGFEFEKRGGLHAISFNFNMPHLKAGQYSFCYSANIHQGSDHILAFKHDFDFSIEVIHAKNRITDQQAGLVLVDNISVDEIKTDLAIIEDRVSLHDNVA
jgi:ABC-type polysaccharide/polyol phosphate transport system ATPase subunit